MREKGTQIEDERPYAEGIKRTMGGTMNQWPHKGADKTAYEKDEDKEKGDQTIKRPRTLQTGWHSEEGNKKQWKGGDISGVCRGMRHNAGVSTS